MASKRGDRDRDKEKEGLKGSGREGKKQYHCLVVDDSAMSRKMMIKVRPRSPLPNHLSNP